MMMKMIIRTLLVFSLLFADELNIQSVRDNMTDVNIFLQILSHLHAQSHSNTALASGEMEASHLTTWLWAETVPLLL